VLDGSRQVGGLVGRAEPAPQDEVGARRDRGGRIDLQEREALDHRDQVGRPRRVEELRVYRDAAGLSTVETVNDHAADPSDGPL